MNKTINNKLAFKLAVIIIFIVGFISVLSTLYFNRAISTILNTYLQNKIISIVQFAKIGYPNPLYNYNDPVIDDLNQAIIANKMIVAINIYDQRKIFLSGLKKNNYGLQDSINMKAAFQIKEGHNKIIKESGQLKYDNELVGFFEIFYTTKFIEGIIGQTSIKMIFSFLMAGLFITILIFISVNKLVIKPILNLAHTSDKIAKSKEFSLQLEIRRKDEIGILCNSFNNMMMQIKQNDDEKDNMFSKLHEMHQKVKKSEKELRQLRNYLSNIIDSMPSVLVGVDTKGRITQWNQTAEHTIGITAKEAQGKSLLDVFPAMAHQMERINQSIQTRQTLQDKKRVINSKTSTRYEDITVYPLIANGVDGAVIRIDDITEQVRLEEMMVQSEKMLSVGGLAAGMAHEINNPLAGMMQTGEVMASRLADIEMEANVRAAKKIGIDMESIKAFMEARGILRMVETINDSGQRVAKIVDNMLSFARKSDVSVSTYDLADLLDKILELASTDYNLKKHYDFKTIEIVKEYEPDLPMVPCEGAKIQQVLLNILRNGAQAMQDYMDKTCDQKPKFILRLSQETGKGMLRMEIEDNGPGMDGETRKRIFEPFFTTKPVGDGTGLGLSVSYFIITQNHGGTMDVISEIGKGAKFIIRLPLETKRYEANVTRHVI